MNTKGSAIKNNSLMAGFFIALLFTNIIMIASLSMEITQLERVCSYIIMIFSFILYIYSFFIDSIFTLSDFLFVIMFFYLLLLSVANGWGYDNYVSALVFLSMLTVWRSSSAIKFNSNMKTVILMAFSMQGILLIGLAFSPLAYKSYQEYVLVSKELTLGLSNPNQTGIILFSTIVVLILSNVKEQHGQRTKALIWIEILILSVLLILTDARTSILAYAFFLFFMFFRKKPIKKNYFISDFVLCFPIIFVYIYMKISNTQLKNVMFLGKKFFSGRQRVFSEALSMFSNKWFGNLTYFNFQNAHNSHLTVLINIGIVGLIIYLLFSISSFNLFNKRCENRRQILCVIAILALFIMGCMETAVLTGGTVYFTHMLTILAIAANQKNEE